MTYIELINAFEKWCETNYLPSSAQLLWYKLIALFNKAGWSEWVTVDNYRLMSVMQMSSEKTLIRCRDKLIECNLFEYQKGKKGFPNKYKICTVNFTVQMTVQTPVQMTVKTTANVSNINRLRQDKEKEDKEDGNPLVEIYNVNCPLLPKVQKITDKRTKAINKFLKEFSIEQFTEICKIANNSSFLTGHNNRGWKADFDFLLRTDKATSILEGKYGDTKTEEKKQEEYKELDLSRLTDEEYGLLMKKKITIQELIEKGKINV